MAITLSERVAQEFKKICDEQSFEEGTALRVGVVGGGCSGFQYSLAPDMNVDSKVDSTFDCHGVKLDGTTIDFYDGLEKRGFTFDNPTAVKSCGCGSSFQA